MLSNGVGMRRGPLGAGSQIWSIHTTRSVSGSTAAAGRATPGLRATSSRRTASSGDGGGGGGGGGGAGAGAAIGASGAGAGGGAPSGPTSSVVTRK